VIGEWVIDIDLNALQLFVFKGLIHKPSPITGRELRFMRKYMDLTTEELGRMLGCAATHAIVNREKERGKMSLVQDVYLRMLFMGMLKDREINSIFKEIET
jgi:DNA-binding XRE family transcriptional regulator